MRRVARGISFEPSGLGLYDESGGQSPIVAGISFGISMSGSLLGSARIGAAMTMGFLPYPRLTELVALDASTAFECVTVGVGLSDPNVDAATADQYVTIGVITS